MKTQPPTVNIDPQAFAKNPYPTLAKMRAETPICFVPQLNAVLFTKRDDIFTCEKNIEVFSSEQPGGLMTQLMGENMMRKDGEAHTAERKQMFPAVSPKTVRDQWRQLFQIETAEIIKELIKQDEADLVADFALPVSGKALCHMTGLTNISAQEMDWASQSMIDGVGNYQGDPDIEAKCHEATTMLDAAIDEMIKHWAKYPDNLSITAVLSRSGQPLESIRANVKLAISGGQNEPRDAIAGCIWALLSHPKELQKVRDGEATWLQVFEEYARWVSPIGMSPRELKQDFEWNGISLEKGSRIFFMFGSANRDETYFANPDVFDVSRDTTKAVSFWCSSALLCRGCGISQFDCGCCFANGV
jgi:cytochrome P450